MWEYIVKSGLCLFILYSFYRLFLESEQLNFFKRFFLLAILIISMVLPLVTFSYTVTDIPDTTYLGENVIYEQDSNNNDSSTGKVLPYLLAGIYFIGFLIYLGRFAKNLKSLLQDIKSNKKFRKLNYVFVLLEREISPYTFLNYIFLNRTEYRNNAISEAILEHEKVHVDQRHSLDLLIVEFIQIFFWFNPIFHWIKRSMKLNHEYLADEGVINKEIDAVQYSRILCNYSSGHYHNILSSPMSQSLIKKRIIMISKTFSIRKLTLRLGLLVPVLVFCLYFFNNEIKAKPVLATTEAEMIFKNKMIQDPNIISIKIKEAKLYVNGDQTPVNEFAQVIDSKIAGKNDEDLQEMGIEMKMIDPDEKFVELVNSEFKKSRLAKLTGMSMLPPPPPLPPNPDAAARPPKAPSATKGKNVEIKEEVTIENGKKKIIKEKIITGEKYKVEKEIENLPKDADYYVNDKKVERSEALNVMENSKVLRVDIKKEDGDKDIVKIYTE